MGQLNIKWFTCPECGAKAKALLGVVSANSTAADSLPPTADSLPTADPPADAPPGSDTVLYMLECENAHLFKIQYPRHIRLYGP